MGNSFATLNAGGSPTVMLSGHIDEIGLMVTHIDEKGLLRFTGVGGWDSQVLVGQRVRIKARDGEVRGVIGKKAIHVMEPEERKKVSDIKSLWIDVGAKDGDEAKGMVRIGDVGRGGRRTSSSSPTAASPPVRWTTGWAPSSSSKPCGC